MAWTTPVNEPATPDKIASSARHNSQVLENLRDLHGRSARTYTNNDAAAVAVAGVVAVTATGVETTTTAGDSRPIAVALANTPSTNTGDFRLIGVVNVRVTGAVARGDPLQTSATAQYAQVGTSNPFALALEANASGTTIIAAIMAPLKAAQGAPTNAQYLTRTADAGLSAEFDLSTLAAGGLAHSVSGGVSTPRALAAADISAGWLLDAVARVGIQKNGTPTANRRSVNLIEGTGITLTEADNSGSERVDVTIAASGGGGATNPWAHALAFR